MKTLVCIAGPCGAGKSNYIKRNFSCKVFDDKDFRPFGRDYFDLISALESNDKVVITHQWFCRKEILDNFIFAIRILIKNLIIEYVYFERDIVNCAANIIRRCNFRNYHWHLDILFDNIEFYDIPIGVKTIPVYKTYEIE